MSYVEIYTIDAVTGVVGPEPFTVERNAMAGALLIWLKMTEKYGLQNKNFEFKEIWAFVGDPASPMEYLDRICVASTFDAVWVRIDKVGLVADAWEHVWKWIARRDSSRVDTIPRVAAALRRILRENESGESGESGETRPLRGVCFNQTSVCSNPWVAYEKANQEIANDTQDDSQSEVEEEDSLLVPFQFGRHTRLANGKEPWELFGDEVFAGKEDTQEKKGVS